MGAWVPLVVSGMTFYYQHSRRASYYIYTNHLLEFSLTVPNNWKVYEHERLDNVVTISVEKGIFFKKEIHITVSSLYLLNGLIDLSSRELSFEAVLSDLNEAHGTSSLPFIQAPTRIDTNEKPVLFAQIMTSPIQDASITWDLTDVQNQNDYQTLNLYQIRDTHGQNNIVAITFYASNDSQLDGQSLDIITSFQFVPAAKYHESHFESQ